MNLGLKNGGYIYSIHGDFLTQQTQLRGHHLVWFYGNTMEDMVPYRNESLYQVLVVLIILALARYWDIGRRQDEP